MPRKFDQDAKDRVVHLVEDRILAENMSMQAACQAVAPKLGVSRHTARQWTQAGALMTMHWLKTSTVPTKTS